MAETTHESVFFSGHVQGVGFRYTTLQIAKEFEVTGYVQNLPDGRVQLEVEGHPKDVRDFIATIHERMHGYIRRIEQKNSAATREFSSFTIK